MQVTRFRRRRQRGRTSRGRGLREYGGPRSQRGINGRWQQAANAKTSRDRHPWAFLLRGRWPPGQYFRKSGQMGTPAAASCTGQGLCIGVFGAARVFGTWSRGEVE